MEASHCSVTEFKDQPIDPELKITTLKTAYMIEKELI